MCKDNSKPPLPAGYAGTVVSVLGPNLVNVNVPSVGIVVATTNRMVRPNVPCTAVRVGGGWKIA